MPINRVTIVGNLTRDPELRGLPSGGSVCSMRVAVNERRKDASGQWSDAPNFFNVTAFGSTADNCAKFLVKGRQIAVDGRLRWREYQDRSGNKREAIEIVAQDVQFVGGKDGARRDGPPPMGEGDAPGGYGYGQGDSGPTSTGGDDWSGPGSSYPVDGPGFSGGGGPSAPAPSPGPAPAPADDDIPF